ncbi:MAG: pyridoxal-phosphate dependent enzyme [Deltaproteobacteria bacterium]|nr:pyridoxal-phosphate dependent enzyme [Deltaproteobacteria bacterium]
MAKFPLFEKYAGLKKHVPWMSLAALPTPVAKLDNLGKMVGHHNLWIKRDDKSSDIYGGNKVRKLEFILADALRRGCKWVITYGGIGTNHGLATTIHARRLGLKTALVLIRQPLTDHVQENLLLDHHFGAEIHYAPSNLRGALQTAGIYLRHGKVYFIPPGGSSVLGSLGYVNAALELKKQIDDGLLPEPEYIFCALGSKGTLAGLMLGTRLSGMKTKVVGVRVAMEWVTDTHKTVRLINRLVSLMRKYDKEVPPLKFTMDDLMITHDFLGAEYGAVTQEGEQALDLMERTEGIRLDLTYTAKTMAAMLDFIKKHPEVGKTPILFWDTYNSVDLTDLIRKKHDHAVLPRTLQWCFQDNLITGLKDIDTEF